MLQTWILEEAPELEKAVKLVSAADKLAKNSETWCSNDYWYLKIKPIIVSNVGYCAKNDKLQGYDIYDEVYQNLYNDLPECRRCACIQLQNG